MSFSSAAESWQQSKGLTGLRAPGSSPKMFPFFLLCDFIPKCYPSAHSASVISLKCCLLGKTKQTKPMIMPHIGNHPQNWELCTVPLETAACIFPSCSSPGLVEECWGNTARKERVFFCSLSNVKFVVFFLWWPPATTLYLPSCSSLWSPMSPQTVLLQRCVVYVELSCMHIESRTAAGLIT